MAKKVGCGDLGTLVSHLESIVTDVEAGDFSDVWTHVWGALDEIRAAAGGCAKPMFGSSGGGDTCPKMAKAPPKSRHAAIKEACEPLKEFVEANKGMKGGEDTTAIDFKSLFQKLLALLLALVG